MTLFFHFAVDLGVVADFALEYDLGRAILVSKMLRAASQIDNRPSPAGKADDRAGPKARYVGTTVDDRVGQLTNR